MGCLEKGHLHSVRLLPWLTAVAGLFLLALPAPGYGAGQTPPVSDATQACLGCHSTVHPGIVADWKSSRHAQITPAQALRKPKLERRISSTNIPERLRNHVVGCYECHSLNGGKHKDNFEHFGFRINVVVSPDDCAVCHRTEAEQFAGSKKAMARANLDDNPLYHTLVDEVLSKKEIADGKLIARTPLPASRANSCFGCHGTKVMVKGMKTVDTAMGKIKVPDLDGWPNQGIGRINPDGSRGSCTACHPRHSFAIAIARQPATCSQCHQGPDVPAYSVYTESKHGNIYSAMGKEWNWEAVPWTPGKDFKAPTCAVCHDALLVSPDGKVIAQRSHDFGARLWVRIFGLIYSHPQPKKGDTTLIRNADGLPLPTTFSDKPASKYLIDAQEQQVRRHKMQRVCTACHATPWATGFFNRFHQEIGAADTMVLTSTNLLQEAWSKGLADKSNPFDEPIEKMWVRQWLFYANTVRYAAAMAGPDYASFKDGWWDLSETLREMQEKVGVTEARTSK